MQLDWFDRKRAIVPFGRRYPPAVDRTGDRRLADTRRFCGFAEGVSHLSAPVTDRSKLRSANR